MLKHPLLNIESINSDHEYDEDSSKLPDKNSQKNTLIDFIDKIDEKPTESQKEQSLEEKFQTMDRRMKTMEENLEKKVLDFKMKRKTMRKSLQIIEKIDQQQNQSGEDLNLIWKTINTIVMNSKAYFEDVRKELEQRIQEFKHEITGLLNFDDVKNVIEELKKNNIDGLVTEEKCRNIAETAQKEIYECVERNMESKLLEMGVSHQKLNELIAKDKLFWGNL